MKPLSVIRPLLILAAVLFGTVTHADETALKAEVAAEQQAVTEAKAAREAAQKKRDELAAQQAKTPGADIERKLKDADYELMMADSKLNSATRSLERLQKKLDEMPKAAKPAVVASAAVSATSPVTNSAEQAKAAAEQEAAKKLADEKAAAEKAAAEKAAAEKAAAEKARKEEEARLAQQKAAEAAAEAAKNAAEAEAAQKKQALAAELGIDLNNCLALPTAPTNAAGSLSDADKTQQAYALGDLKRINRLVSEKTPDDVPPVSPFPMLEGSKLKPCDPENKQALRFGYMGNAQYRLETRVLAGQQDFYVKGVIEPIQRLIPDADNGEVYVFFLDLKYQPRLLAYKKSLFDQPETQPAQ